MEIINKDLDEEIELTNFTSYCKKDGFSGPTMGCVRKAMSNGTTNAYNMAKKFIDKKEK
jgi:hypothetical protein